MMLVALAALLRFGRNIPLAEDWLLVSPLTGNEPNLINWLWALNNEHRIPLPRLVMLVLLKATRGDFRAGMLFSIVTLGALSLATIRVARSIRGGRTSYADAFFPVAFLHLGNWENLLWSWQLSFVLSMLLACWLLFVLVSPRGLTTPGGAVVAGISLVLLPLTGATGLLFVPVLALWLGYSGVVQWSRATTHDRPRWIGVFLIAAAAVALCLVGLYFVGYERPAWAPPNPGVRASLWAALQFLALGFGPIARSFWTPSTLAAIGVLLPTAAVAVLAVLRHRGLERHRALRMLAFFGSMVVYALAVGWGRAGAIEVYGGWPLRYVLLANLALCTVFFIWELYGPSKLRTVVQYGLFLAIFLLLPFNTVHGLEWRNYYRNGMEAVEQDILSGTPRSVLAERHRDFLIHWWDVDTLEAHMQMLQDSGFGPFADVQEASVVSEDSQPPPGGAIDEQAALPQDRSHAATTAPRTGLGWREVTLVFVGAGIALCGIALSRLPHRRSATGSSRRLLTLQIVMILLVAAILRFNRIRQPFTDYVDWRQASTAMMAENFHKGSWNILYPEVSWDGPGPSYQGREFQTVSYIAALLYTVVGQHDWVGRSVAVMFGLWGIFALYHLCRRVWDEEHAIASAAVMALLPGSIFIDRSFIPDPAMVALVVTSFWMLVAYLQTERWYYLALASISGALGLLTKIPGLILGLPMAYATLTILRSKDRLLPKKLAILGAAALLTLIPVVAYYLWARYLSVTYPPYHFAGTGNWLWNEGLRKWWEQGYFLPLLIWNIDHWLWAKPVIILVLIGLCLRPPQWAGFSAADRQSEGSSGKTPWLFHWWIFAGIVYYLIGAKELVVNSWNLHIVSPAAAALAGHAILWIATYAKRVARLPDSLARIALILLFIGTHGQIRLQSMYYPPWDSMKNYELGLALRQISTQDELVVTIPVGTIEPVAIYYSQRRGWSFPPLWPEVQWHDDMTIDDLEAIRLYEKLRAQGADWLGIVASRIQELSKNNPQFMEHIERTCELAKHTPTYVIYRIPSPEEASKPAPTQVQAATRAADTPPVSQEIRYHSAEATEVFLVWGINGWNVAPEGTRPDGTVIQNEVMHTPMVQEGGVFIAKVQVPLDTTIDYGFLITRKRGSPDAVAPIWDGSQDYQVIATADGIVEAKATPTLVKEVSRVLDSRHLFLIGSVILASAWFSIYFLLGLRDRQVKLEDTPQ
jgi:hypothetical protein